MTRIKSVLKFHELFHSLLWYAHYHHTRICMFVHTVYHTVTASQAITHQNKIFFQNSTIFSSLQSKTKRLISSCINSTGVMCLKYLCFSTTKITIQYQNTQTEPTFYVIISKSLVYDSLINHSHKYISNCYYLPLPRFRDICDTALECV